MCGWNSAVDGRTIRGGEEADNPPSAHPPPLMGSGFALSLPRILPTAVSYQSTGGECPAGTLSQLASPLFCSTEVFTVGLVLKVVVID